MATKESTTQEIRVPEWEHEAGRSNDKEQATSSAPRKQTGAPSKTKLDSILPPHKRYLGLSRKIFLCVLLGALLALLVLIIGLAAGLSTKSGNQNLPLPSNADKFTGELTYFETGLGACGETNDQDDHIVSISHFVFDAAGSSSSTGGNSNANPLCGKTVRARRYSEEDGAERSIDLKVADRCTGCQPTDLDVTMGAFEGLADSALGRVDVTWAWLEPVATAS